MLRQIVLGGGGVERYEDTKIEIGEREENTVKENRTDVNGSGRGRVLMTKTDEDHIPNTALISMYKDTD